MAKIIGSRSEMKWNVPKPLFSHKTSQGGRIFLLVISIFGTID